MRRQIPRRARLATLALAAAVVWVAHAPAEPVAAQPRQLRLVSTPWPPFTDTAGQPRFALDLVEAAVGRMGLSAVTTIVSASQFTTSLLEGPFDGSAAAWKDAARERVLQYSDPYLENRLILVGRQGGDVSAAALADLKGRRVAIVDGYSYGDGVDNAGPTFVRARSEEESLELLLTSAVDYVLMDDLVVQYIASNHADEARTRLQFGTTPLVTRTLHLAVRRDLPDADSIISRFNAQLRGMVADGTYHRLLRLDWLRADVDGDGVPELVPASERVSRTEPPSAYSLSLGEAGTSPLAVGNRFYIGGKVYTDWGTVPQTYKVYDNERPDPQRSLVPIFKFTW